jgi:hypothetical protein
MIADGEQFDWVVIESRSGKWCGADWRTSAWQPTRDGWDHNQLSPFDVVDRQRFYNINVAAELLTDAIEQTI